MAKDYGNKVIAIKEETKQKLDNLKLVPTETYDNIIKRMLEDNK